MQKVDQLTEKLQAIRDNDLVAIRKDIESVDKQASNARQELEIVRKKNLSSEKTARSMADLIQLNKVTKFYFAKLRNGILKGLLTLQL